MAPAPAREDAPEDADVHAAIAAGDVRRALTQLMERYGAPIYQFAYGMTRSHATADDVRQQVFLEAYRDLATYAGRATLRTWLFAIARHRCIDAGRARRRWWHRIAGPPSAGMALALDDLDASVDRGRIARLLAECLARLQPAAREAVLLRYAHELPFEDAARIAGVRAGTLQRRAARALPALRRCLSTKLDAPARGAPRARGHWR
jgi:RNA polymerase sigma-70 factor (ECF subfamily)